MVRLSFKMHSTRSIEDNTSGPFPDAQVEVLTWALTLSADNQSSISDETIPVHQEKDAVAGLGLRDVFNPDGDEPLRVPVFDRDSLEPGDVFEGPCIVVEKDTSTLRQPGFCRDVGSTRYHSAQEERR